ncbi:MULTISPECIES: type IV toxin-antitoxin system AbiEi family antitoxin domain-containing protein [Pediococcus]|mgnify:CR=1 FL=1|jgi:predicted transcriptional regulator of viral defense system|uniref:type IV toxin-antitoxin system AbiEi family antitoxin domain-containing protein n=1 Tax=Pediococcus TaxID=1253 RepID=UPI000E98C716|nr:MULTISPECIES: type IV toxin-antitoxin system AbiEi family antitoxin domain-containing protein [Pediococcus]MCT3028869.1 abortive infection protein [Pediococcus parvulus]MCT3034865.1 abortive infection protein [Pediococcus parvulus]HBO47535.1 abortive infection protein [Pediococcus sp.]
MSQQSEIIKYLNENGGQMTSREASSMGISPRVLRNMYAHGQLERLAPGVYIDPVEFGDDIAALQYRLSKGVFFKDTALFLYGMIDRTPSIYEMNFPLPYAYSTKTDAPIKIYRQKKEFFEIGITTTETPGKHVVKVYDVERTLCDILRTRDRSDAETIKQAMNNYAKMRGKNIPKLTEYADIFKVRDEIQKYMEVLL